MLRLINKGGGGELLYRIYVERVDPTIHPDTPNINEIVEEYFDGYTVMVGIGVDKGKQEACWIIDIADSGAQNPVMYELFSKRIRGLCARLKEVYQQESVLVVAMQTTYVNFI